MTASHPKKSVLPLLLLVAASACTTASVTPHPSLHQSRQPSDVTLTWPTPDSGLPGPPLIIDASWLDAGDSVVSLTESVYAFFPSGALARRRHPLRIVPRQIVGVPEERAPILTFDGSELKAVLDTGALRWSQYAYQLSHELCHALIMSPATDDIAGWNRQMQMLNQWVDEMLCELASFQVLAELAERWVNDPPFPGARSYAPNFRSYVHAEDASAQQIPSHTRLESWVSDHREYLREYAYDRAKNAAIAIRLLPLFADRPSLWVCVTYLNVNATEAERDQLSSLLRGWRARGPESCRADIEAFAAALGVAVN